MPGNTFPSGNSSKPTKVCRACGKSYPATRAWFFEDKSQPDGLSYRCFSCTLRGKPAADELPSTASPTDKPLRKTRRGRRGGRNYNRAAKAAARANTTNTNTHQT